MKLPRGVDFIVDIFLRLEVEGRESWLDEVSKANYQGKRRETHHLDGYLGGPIRA